MYLFLYLFPGNFCYFRQIMRKKTEGFAFAKSGIESNGRQNGENGQST